MLETNQAVIRCLSTWTDWWQPTSSSIVSLDARRPSLDQTRDPFRQGLLESIDERTELRWRLDHLEAVDREILYRFYVLMSPAEQVAEDVGLSTRQCFRRRNAAVRALAALAEPPAMAEWVG